MAYGQRARAMLVAAVALVALLVPGLASAWTEARASSIATELAIDHDGAANVTLRIRWTVLGGRMHQFELADLPTDLTLQEATAVAGNGEPVPVAARAPTPGRVEVNLGDELRGVRRGTVDVVIRYTTSLRAQGAIRRAGADAVIEVATIPWSRAVEGIEVRVTLPESVRRAQWIPDSTPGIDATTATELSRDVVHARRRHLPAGERWTAHIAVDPGLFPWLSAGVAHRPNTVRRVELPYALTAGLAAALGLALFVFARLLPRSTPPDEGRLSRAAPALAFAGVGLQALHAVHAPWALVLGSVSLGLAAFARLPPLAVSTPPRATARTVSERELLATSPLRMERARALALVLAAVSVAAVIAASLREVVWAAVAATDLAMAFLVWTAWASRAHPLSDTAVLLPVAARVRVLLKRDARARIAWRVRGHVGVAGSLAARVVPRPGSRLARGLRSIECRVVDVRDGITATRAPELALRFEAGAAVERELRLLSTRAGALHAVGETGSMEYRASLAGPDADVVMAAVGAMLPKLFVPSPAQGSATVADADDQGLAAAQQRKPML